jgi:site-specific recombinase XerD
MALSREQIVALHRAKKDAPYAANWFRAAVSKLYAWASDESLLPEGYPNPVRRIARHKEQARERFLTREELERLGDALAAAPDPHMVAAIRVLLLTGARVNEILHARWNFIDFERGLLNLPDSKTGKKSVYINAPALEILASLLRLEGNPFIFPVRKRGAPLARLDRPWTAIKKAAGLDDLRLHDLRHSHASIGAGAGLSLPIIGKILDDKPICAFGARSCTCSVRDNWCGDCRRSGRSEAGATDSIADAQMSARKDAKTFMAWALLVHGHQWIDREPLDLAAIEAEIVRLLRAEHPVPAFAQKWLVGWYSPRGDLGRGEDGYAARKFRNERRDYERELKIPEKVTNGEKSVDAAIKEVLIEEKKANGESDAEITDGQLRQGKRSAPQACLDMPSPRTRPPVRRLSQKSC